MVMMMMIQEMGVTVLIELWPSGDQCQSGEGQGAFPPRRLHLVGPTPIAADMRKHSPLLLNGANIEDIERVHT